MRLPRDRFDYSPFPTRPALEAPQGGPHRGVDHRQRRGVGHREGDGAPVPAHAPGGGRRARRAQLGLARLRDARRLLAAAGGADRGGRSAPPPPSTPTWSNRYEPVARAMLDAGWEFMAHGVVQGAMHLLPDQRKAIRQAVELHREVHRQEAEGLARRRASPRRGRRSTTSAPRASSTSPTGSTTTSPTRSAPPRGRSFSVPYSIELNDIPMMVVQHHTSSEWLQRCKDQFDRLYAEGREEPAGDGAGRPSVHLGRPAPHQVLRGGVRLHAQEARRVDDHRRGDLRVVPAVAPVIASRRASAVLALGLLAAALPGVAEAQGGPKLTVPPGFAIDVFADKVGSVRFMAIDPAGTLLVSEPSAGRVLALPDRNADGKADRVQTWTRSAKSLRREKKNDTTL